MAFVPDRARPFVAALLGLLVTGFGHIYLRRWLRAVAWFAVAFAVSLVFVPETTAAAILAGESVDPVSLLPGALVGVVSALDAFIIARREVSTGAEAAVANGDAERETETNAATETVDCPACGQPVDPDLGFCHWCTTEFEGGGTDDANNAN
ncbi:MAG: zinc ribbon domain-containing protein [Halolamina sp.]